MHSITLCVVDIEKLESYCMLVMLCLKFREVAVNEKTLMLKGDDLCIDQ